MHLVLIDLDGTLLWGMSAEQRLMLRLVQHGRIGPHQMMAAAAFLRRRRRWQGPAAWKANKAYLAGLSVAEVDADAAAVAHAIEPRLSTAMRERVSAHQRAGHLTVLLSGTLSCIADPLASLLGVHHCIATLCETANGRYTGGPPRRHPIGLEKRRLAEAFCNEAGTRLDDCTAYADAAHDIPLLEAVSHPVAVNPDRVLERTALLKGWDLLHPRSRGSRNRSRRRTRAGFGAAAGGQWIDKR